MPILCEMQRFLEQLSIIDPPSVKKELILEQVFEIESCMSTLLFFIGYGLVFIYIYFFNNIIIKLYTEIHDFVAV